MEVAHHFSYSMSRMLVNGYIQLERILENVISYWEFICLVSTMGKFVAGGDNLQSAKLSYAHHHQDN